MTAKVLLSMPEEFLAQIDALAHEEQRTRSELVREALRQYLRVRRGLRPGNRAPVRAAIALQDALSQAAPGLGEDSAADVRQWRESR